MEIYKDVSYSGDGIFKSESVGKFVSSGNSEINGDASAVWLIVNVYCFYREVNSEWFDNFRDYSENFQVLVLHTFCLYE